MKKVDITQEEFAGNIKIYRFQKGGFLRKTELKRGGMKQNSITGVFNRFMRHASTKRLNNMEESGGH